MNNDITVREWFGAVRAAADKAREMLADPPARETLSRVKTDLLLRHRLCNGVQMLIAQAEGVSRREADTIHDAIFSELMEDAMAGFWPQRDSLEMMRFFDLCMNTSDSMPMFTELLRRALNTDVSGETAALVAETADRELEVFAKQRKALRTAT